MTIAEPDAKDEMLANAQDGSSYIYHRVPREDDGLMIYHPYHEKWE